MSTIELSLLFGAVACIIGLVTFMIGRQSAAKSDGERWGRLEADIVHMRDDISYIKTTLEKNDSEHKASIRRLHERLNEHLRQEHGMKITTQGDG